MKEQNILKQIGKSIKGLFIRLFGFGRAKKDYLKEEEIMSPAKQILKKFFRNRIAITGLIVFILIVGFVVIGNQSIDFRPSYYELSQGFVPPKLGYNRVPKDLQESGVKVVVDDNGNDMYLIDGGATFTVAVSNDDKIYVWGAEIYNNDITTIPDEIQEKAGEIVRLSVGIRHAVVLTESGELLGWGRNHFEQAQVPVYNEASDKDFGEYKKSIEAYFRPEARTLYPEHVITTIEEDPIRELHAGFEYTTVLTESGVVFTWGSTRNNELSEPRFTFRFMQVNFRADLRAEGAGIEWRQEGYSDWTLYKPLDEIYSEFRLLNAASEIVEFRLANNKLQWKYSNEPDTDWTDLVSTDVLIEEFDLTVDPVKQIEFQLDQGKLQWKYDVDVEWIDLATEEELLDDFSAKLRFYGDDLQWKLNYEKNSEYQTIISKEDILTDIDSMIVKKKVVSVFHLIDNIAYEFDDNTYFLYGIDGEVKRHPDFLSMTPDERGKVQYRYSDNPEIRLKANLEWNNYGNWEVLALRDELIEDYGLQTIIDNAGEREILFRINENDELEWKYDDENEWTLLLDSDNYLLDKLSYGLEYKFSHEKEWKQLITYGNIKDEYNIPEVNGKVIEINYSNNRLQWKYDDEDTWTDVATRFALNIEYGLNDVDPYRVIRIDGNRGNAFALSDRGMIYGWGQKTTANTIIDIPEEVQSSFVVDIEMGMYHIVALDNRGNVYTWGFQNDLNQLDMPSNLPSSVEIVTSYFNNISISEDGEVTMWGNNGYVFGSTQNGGDLFKRVIAGGGMTLLFAAVAVLITTFIGVTIGLIAGFYGKWVDNLLMRFGEVVQSFPFLPLVMTLAAFVQYSDVDFSERDRLYMIMFIIGVLSWPWLSRLVRGQILSEREKDFVLAAKALGVKERHIILRHILPNVLNVVTVYVALSYASLLLTEAGLSYLGFGVQEPEPSWGNILTSAENPTILRYYWWLWIIPGMFVILTALSINLVGDGLREAMDPKGLER